MATRKAKSGAAAAVEHLRERGLRYPGASLKSPWPGHADLAVDDKTFAYLSAPGDPPHVSFKLPVSHPLALSLPGAEPTPYGLGKSGWVSLSLDAALPPVAQLEAWLDESYRAQAKKKRLAELDAGASAGARRPASERSGGRQRRRAR
ncbi:MAG: MmcQ/YjbR family DNA-binding protein [Planctomycetes bacterium]|nr:MmcQ/YjbR family DNA-binding protein [Planctomycetota bacterium]